MTKNQDLFGKAYYFIGKIEWAYFFHSKAVEGVKEPIQSPIRNIGESIIKHNG